ncbi:MAG: class I SAM-dependent methyltransferase [Acidobacteria bacterium]|nr:class I SAM-dependent methyltransferase [Acidobacteriota bacterium]
MSEVLSIRDYFTRSAIAFDSLYSQQQSNSFVRFVNHRFRRDIYERFLLSLNHVRRFHLDSVLDVGCGSGRYAEAFAQLGIRTVVGIDLSEKMIELAKQRTHHAGIEPEFLCGDFMEFETTRVFDVAVAMGLFDYVADPLPTLKRMRSLVTHSVVASFPSISWYRTPIRKVRYFCKRCPVYFYRRKQIGILGQASGFASTHIKKIEGAGQDYFVIFSTVHDPDFDMFSSNQDLDSPKLPLDYLKKN